MRSVGGYRKFVNNIHVAIEGPSIWLTINMVQSSPRFCSWFCPPFYLGLSFLLFMLADWVAVILLEVEYSYTYYQIIS